MGAGTLRLYDLEQSRSSRVGVHGEWIQPRVHDINHPLFMPSFIKQYSLQAVFKRLLWGLGFCL